MIAEVVNKSMWVNRWFDDGEQQCVWKPATANTNRVLNRFCDHGGVVGETINLSHHAGPWAFVVSSIEFEATILDEIVALTVKQCVGSALFKYEFMREAKCDQYDPLDIASASSCDPFENEAASSSSSSSPSYPPGTMIHNDENGRYKMLAAIKKEVYKKTASIDKKVYKKPAAMTKKPAALIKGQAGVMKKPAKKQ